MNKDELKELAATLSGIADGKKWERTNSITDEWREPDHIDPVSCVSMGRKIRLKPWQLPQPPDGMQWHRDDWTEEMLPEGYRPSLMWETGDGEVSTNGGKTWRVDNCPDMPVKDYYRDFYRTKRPLPQPQQPDPYAELKSAHAAGKVIELNVGDDENPDWVYCIPNWQALPKYYRIKPEQQKVPLGSEDVLPMSAILADTADAGAWMLVTGVISDGLEINGRSEITWQELKNYWQINRSIPLTGKWNPEAWQPCYKLIDTP